MTPKFRNLLTKLLLLVTYLLLFWGLDQFNVEAVDSFLLFIIPISLILLSYSYLNNLYERLLRNLSSKRTFPVFDKLVDYTSSYKYGSDYSQFVEGIAKLLSVDLNMKMTSIFMDSGKAFTQDAVYGAEDGKELKLSVIGGGNFEELLVSTDDYIKLEKDLFFRTVENKRLCLLCIEKGFSYVIPLKIDDKPVGMIFSETLDEDYFVGENGKSFRNALNSLSKRLRMSKLNSILEKEYDRKNTMLGLTEKLSALDDAEELLKSVLEYLSGVISFDAAGIFLVKGKDKKIINRHQVGYDNKRLKELDLKVGKGVIGMSIEQKKAILIPDVAYEPAYIPVRETTGSEICVPLIRRGIVIGAFNVENDETYAYGFDDLEMLTGISNIAAVAIDNAILFKEFKEKEELERDLTIAADIQRALLPINLPDFPGLEIEASTIPSKLVGGDLYDVSSFASGRISIAIGDVSGKGVPAAILMANLYASYKSLARTNLPVENLLSNLNEIIYDNTADDRYATFFYGVYDPDDRKMAYCNGGHNPPILLRIDGSIELLKVGGPAIGFVTDGEYSSEVIEFSVGDYLVLYTDGVTEAEDPSGNFYGNERLEALLTKTKSTSALKLSEEIMKDLNRFRKGSNQPSDDITLICIKII
ncbi:MAG: SpoIIE family protein phosphatase [Candidatus Marinimicrobia bacterium]|nr:SpoIIE family protein phosphatase [Candidatus Neomarinimicrobiota bacterium]